MPLSVLVIKLFFNISGLKESPLVTHEDSLTLARLEDEVRRQLKVFYPQDD